MQRMYHRMKSISLILCGVILFESLMITKGWAGEDIVVKNIRFEFTGNKVLIHYDVIGPAGQQYNIKVLLKRRKNPRFEFVPKAISGDVGEGRSGGYGKQIVWEIERDFPNGLDGDDFYFRIEAEVITAGSSLLYYLGGGAVVVGTAAYFLLMKKTDSGVSEGTFPKPIGRPTGY
ncbi:MAG: hypothetical protein V1799_13705 [bacterium]